MLVLSVRGCWFSGIEVGERMMEAVIDVVVYIVF